MSEFCPNYPPKFLFNPEITRKIEGVTEYVRKEYDDGVIVVIDTFDGEAETQYTNGDLHYEDPSTNEAYFIEGH